MSIVLGISLRVIMRRPPSGVALAWMFLVAFVPLGGFVFYLMIGERRVGLRRARRIAALRSDYAMLAQHAIDRGLTQVSWDKHRPEARGMDRLGTCLVGMPTVAGSMAQFYSESEQILRAIAHDIDNARKSVLMEFYIWNEGGAADEVFEALVAPASGASPAACWSTRSAPGRGGKAGNRSGSARRASACEPALPVSLLQARVSRNDLRLHRKIVVVDGRVGLDGQHEPGRSPLLQAEGPRRAMGRRHGPPGRIGRRSAGHDHDRRLDAGNGRTDRDDHRQRGTGPRGAKRRRRTCR